MAKNTQMVTVDAEQIKFAREYYGIDLDEASFFLKIKKEKLENFEKGSDFPSYFELTKISDYYRQPLIFFFLHDHAFDEKLMVEFRSIEDQEQKMINKQVREMIERANIYRINLEELQQNDTTDFTTFKTLVHHENVKRNNLALWLREKLHFTIEDQISKFRNANDILEHLRNELFELGIFVFKDAFKDEQVSGLCLKDDRFPIIMLNNKTTFKRQLFTLFHEIYHIFINISDVAFCNDDNEKECNVFASEFLLPKQELLTAYNDLLATTESNIDVVDELSRLFCVSQDAVAYSLYKSKIITKIEYEVIHKKSSAFRPKGKTSGGSYYYTKKSYLGTGYIRKVYQQYYSGLITISQVGLYTQMKSTTAKAFASKVFGGDF